MPIILAPELARQFNQRGHPDALFADGEGKLLLKSMCTDDSRLKYYIATLYPTDLEIGFQGVVNAIRSSVAAPEALAALGGISDAALDNVAHPMPSICTDVRRRRVLNILAAELHELAQTAKGKTVNAAQLLFASIWKMLARRKKEKRGIYRCWMLTVSGRNYANVKNTLMRDIDINQSARKKGCGAKFIGIADGASSLTAFLKMHACFDRRGFKNHIKLNGLQDQNFKTAPIDEYEDSFDWAHICSKVNSVSCQSFFRKGYLSGIADANTWMNTPICPVAVAEATVVAEDFGKLTIDDI